MIIEGDMKHKELILRMNGIEIDLVEVKSVEFVLGKICNGTHVKFLVE